MAKLRFNVSAATGNLNTVSNTSVTGNAVFLGSSRQKVDNLSAYLILTADTANITITPYWQVSNNDSTYVTLRGDAAGEANIPAVTGQANTTVATPAPPGINAYRYARCMLLVGGATGASADLFSIGYSYRQLFG